MRGRRSWSTARAASRWPSRSSGTRPSTGRCCTRARPTAEELCRAEADHRQQREPALRGARARCRTARCLRPGSTSAIAFPRRKRDRNMRERGCSSPSRTMAAQPIAKHGWRRDSTCECCRLGLTFAAPGRPAVIFRNIFEGGVRDHAVMTFTDVATPGEVRRVSNDDWQIARLPASRAEPVGCAERDLSRGLVHQRQGAEGTVLCTLAGRRPDVLRAACRSARPDRSPSRPFVLAGPQGTAMVWKEFDGEKTWSI